MTDFDLNDLNDVYKWTEALQGVKAQDLTIDASLFNSNGERVGTITLVDGNYVFRPRQ